MIRLERFTTAYDPVEDRIRIAGEAGNGARTTAWLNMRLLRLLVPALAGWVERRGPGEGAAALAVQEFHQIAATASFAVDQRTIPAVVSHEPGRLVVSVDYTDLGAAMRLVFKDREGAPFAGLDLPELALRQWLGIVCEAHLAGGWPVDAFPGWLLPCRNTDALPN